MKIDACLLVVLYWLTCLALRLIVINLFVVIK